MVERDEEREISAPAQRDEQDSAMRPQRLSDFVGQHVDGQHVYCRSTFSEFQFRLLVVGF